MGKGDKKGQCNGDDEKFYKWILCCFGYWNTQYSKAVLSALKAYDAKAKDNKGETFIEMATRVAEEAADAVGEALEENESQRGRRDRGGCGRGECGRGRRLA